MPQDARPRRRSIPAAGCSSTVPFWGVRFREGPMVFGHSDPPMTLAVYAQATTAADVAAAQALGDRFLTVKSRYPHDTLAPVPRRHS